MIDPTSLKDLWTWTKIEYLMELVCMDRTWFISNLKTLELNGRLFIDDPMDWSL